MLAFTVAVTIVVVIIAVEFIVRGRLSAIAAYEKAMRNNEAAKAFSDIVNTFEPGRC